jgi:hypothetical protein
VFQLRDVQGFWRAEVEKFAGGVGLLIAPASGEETRADIANKVSDFGEKVRDRERKPQGATGTHGE